MNNFQESFKNDMMEESFNMRSMGDSLPKANNNKKTNYIDFDTVEKVSNQDDTMDFINKINGIGGGAKKEN
jgi:glycerol-3-phosphate responsive antiterminator